MGWRVAAVAAVTLATLAKIRALSALAEHATGYRWQNSSLKDAVYLYELDADMIAATPQSTDWRGKLAGPVRTQGGCGGCWAISAVEQVESAYAKAKGSRGASDFQQLSVEQVLVCCGNNFKTCDGCMGGDTTYAYEYLKNSSGIDTEADYPYDQHTDPFDPPKCKARSFKSVAKLSSWGYAVPRCTGGDCDMDAVAANKETQLATVVANHGPVSICIDAATSFHNYKGGIYDGPCSSKVGDLNHCVQIVGYDLDAKYWLVQNSWGPQWGESGYIRFAMGKNLCGLTDEATIANVSLI